MKCVCVCFLLVRLPMLWGFRSYNEGSVHTHSCTHTRTHIQTHTRATTHTQTHTHTHTLHLSVPWPLLFSPIPLLSPSLAPSFVCVCYISDSCQKSAVKCLSSRGWCLHCEL